MVPSYLLTDHFNAIRSINKVSFCVYSLLLYMDEAPNKHNMLNGCMLPYTTHILAPIAFYTEIWKCAVFCLLPVIAAIVSCSRMIAAFAKGHVSVSSKKYVALVVQHLPSVSVQPRPTCDATWRLHRRNLTVLSCDITSYYQTSYFLLLSARLPSQNKIHSRNMAQIWLRAVWLITILYWSNR